MCFLRLSMFTALCLTPHDRLAQSLSWDESLDSGPEPVGPWLELFFASRGATVRALGGRHLVAGC